MKIQNLSKLITVLAIIAGFTASVSASSLQQNADGIMELPTFYVYASDEATPSDSVNSDTADWSFVKVLDAGADPVAVEIILPGEKSVQVYTPGFSISLVQS